VIPRRDTGRQRYWLSLPSLRSMRYLQGRTRAARRRSVHRVQVVRGPNVGGHFAVVIKRCDGDCADRAGARLMDADIDAQRYLSASSLAKCERFVR